MIEEESLRLAINERVRIVPYDPTWTRRFEDEKHRLHAISPQAFLSVEHIGSTAVATLPAKPIIDIMAGVESMTKANELLPLLCIHGYSTSFEFNATLIDRRWLMRHAEGHRTHHLHLVSFESSEWYRHLAFRDLLRKQPDLRKRYEALKLRLVPTLGSDREAYTEAKADFIAHALANVIT